MVLSAKNAISFGIGQPDFTPPQPVLDGMIQAIQEKKTQYAPTLGLPQLRELVAEKYRSENNLTWVEPKNIIITNGGSQAIQLAYAVLSNPGDAMILSSRISYPIITWRVFTNYNVLKFPATPIILSI